MNNPDDSPHSLTEAVQWVAQITAIAMEMVVPVVLGQYLDQRWGTSYWTLIGAAIGPSVGFWHLLTLTGVVGGHDGRPRDGGDQQP